MQPKDGPPGQLIEDPAEPRPARDGKLLEFNTFRHDLPKATSSQEAWHWLVLLASCVFLGDVFIRRVSVNFAWLPPLLVRLARFRPPPPAGAGPAAVHRASEEPQGGSGRPPGAAPRGDALRVARQAPVDVKPLDELAPPAPAEPRPPGPSLAPEKKEEETYTERLLKAKKKAWEERRRVETKQGEKGHAAPLVSQARTGTL